MAGRGEHMASGQRIEAAERRRQSLELRKNGVDYRRIAELLGYRGQSGAHSAVQTALAEITRSAAEEVRTLELERLDALLFAIHDQVRVGHLPAIDRALRIMERRARLLGLDLAPTPAPTVSLTLILRDLAELAAAAEGLDPVAVIAEAEHWLARAALPA